MPLVEFQLEEGITDVEALRLIESEGGSGSGADSKWQDGDEAENVLRLGGDGDSCVERVAMVRGRGVTLQELQVVARPDTPMAR